MPRCHGVLRTAKREAERERERGRRDVDCEMQGKDVKMTLLEITTATLNVLHYKICDKTFLWGGL